MSTETSTPPIRMRQWLTTGMVARLLDVSPGMVTKWIDDGKLKGARLPDSRDRRVRYRDLVEFAAQYDIPIFGDAIDPQTLILLIPSTSRNVHTFTRIMELLPGVELMRADRLDDVGRSPSMAIIDADAPGQGGLDETIEACRSTCPTIIVSGRLTAAQAVRLRLSEHRDWVRL